MTGSRIQRALMNAYCGLRITVIIFECRCTWQWSRATCKNASIVVPFEHRAPRPSAAQKADISHFVAYDKVLFKSAKRGRLSSLSGMSLIHPNTSVPAASGLDLYLINDFEGLVLFVCSVYCFVSDIPAILMAANYADMEQVRSLHSPPPIPSASRSASSRSPWSLSTHSSAERHSLTLPSVSRDDLTEDLSSYDPLPSPLNHFPQYSSSVHSQSQLAPTLSPQTHRQAENYNVSDSLEPFLTFIDQSPTRSLRSDMTSRTSSIVDLTESSPVMTASQIKKRKTSGEASEVPTKRRKESLTPKKHRASSETSSSQLDNNNIEELDLVAIDDDAKYADFRSKQQADLIKQQQEEAANKPVKLAAFQCIICLDNPTDLTVTHCGIY